MGINGSPLFGSTCVHDRGRDGQESEESRRDPSTRHLWRGGALGPTAQKNKVPDPHTDGEAGTGVWRVSATGPDRLPGQSKGGVLTGESRPSEGVCRGPTGRRFVVRVSLGGGPVGRRHVGVDRDGNWGWPKNPVSCSPGRYLPVPSHTDHNTLEVLQSGSRRGSSWVGRGQ